MVDCGDTLKFENEDALSVYASSDWAERGFCKKCGTMLFWRLKDKTMNAVNADAFDNPGRLKLGKEYYIDEKPGYYSFAEETHKITGQEVLEMFAAEQGQS